MIEIIDKDFLISFMFEYKITQTEFAKRAKLQRKTLYNILHCKHKPSLYGQSCLYRAIKAIIAEHKKRNKKSG